MREEVDGFAAHVKMSSPPSETENNHQLICKSTSTTGGISLHPGISECSIQKIFLEAVLSTVNLEENEV